MSSKKVDFPTINHYVLYIIYYISRSREYKGDYDYKVYVLYTIFFLGIICVAGELNGDFEGFFFGCVFRAAIIIIRIQSRRER